MYQVSNEQFEELLNESIASLSKAHLNHLKNVALIVEDAPSEEQRQQLKLDNHHTLLGLYEGLPLSRRQGTTKLLPDKITIFKLPIEARVNNLKELKEEIRHTLWHEIAHYFGLDHDAISSLDK